MVSIRSELVGDPAVVLLITLPAELVDEAAPLVRDEVMHRLPNAVGAGVILDFAGVQLINSVGITCLLQMQDHAKRVGASLTFAAVPAPVHAFLKQLKLDRRFHMMPTVEDAIAAHG